MLLIFLLRLVGQVRDVEIIKLITKGTIEEQIYKCGLEKLKLDTSMQSIQEDREGVSTSDISSLMNLLKTELESSL